MSLGHEHEHTHPLIVLLPKGESVLSKRPASLHVALKQLIKRPLHHYYLTKDKKKEFWTHQILKFGTATSGQYITATAPILPDITDAAVNKYIYQFDGRIDGEHFVLEVHGADGNPDMGIGIFANVAAGVEPRKWPLGGARIINTWAGVVASTISILSDEEVVTAGNGEAITDPERMAVLQKCWESSPERGAGIERLPLLPSPQAATTPAGQFTAGVVQPWDQRAVTDLLESAPLDAHIRIFTSVFVTEWEMFATVLKVLTAPANTRKVTIMMLDPASAVLEMRYGTEEREIRPSLSAKAVRADIVNQLEQLAEIERRLQRRVDEAKKNSRQPDTGTLEVRVYDCAPTLVSNSTQNESLVGMLLLHDSANQGPMIRVKQGEPMWDMVERNWDTVLALSERRIPAPAEPESNHRR